MKREDLIKLVKEKYSLGFQFEALDEIVKAGMEYFKERNLLGITKMGKMLIDLFELARIEENVKISDPEAKELLEKIKEKTSEIFELSTTKGTYDELSREFPEAAFQVKTSIEGGCLNIMESIRAMG